MIIKTEKGKEHQFTLDTEATVTVTNLGTHLKVVYEYKDAKSNRVIKETKQHKIVMN